MKCTAVGLALCLLFTTFASAQPAPFPAPVEGDFGFLGASYGGPLFGKGRPLDAEKYFIILPDNVGHDGSAKPSDGLRMRFPKDRYADMVKLQYGLVTKGLGLTNLKLVMGGRACRIRMSDRADFGLISNLRSANNLQSARSEIRNQQ